MFVLVTKEHTYKVYYIWKKFEIECAKCKEWEARGWACHCSRTNFV